MARQFSRLRTFFCPQKVERKTRTSSVTQKGTRRQLQLFKVGTSVSPPPPSRPGTPANNTTHQPTPLALLGLKRNISQSRMCHHLRRSRPPLFSVDMVHRRRSWVNKIRISPATSHYTAVGRVCGWRRLGVRKNPTPKKRHF